MMEIVVKIPDDMIKSLEQDNFGAKYNIYDLVGCLMNGTPLPNGHGDLKDEREVVNILLKYAHSEEGRRFANFLVSEIKDAPTIIEADKENTDEEE